jgi:MscS family membrane protein
MNYPPFFDNEILGNKLNQYLIAAVILLVGAALRRLLSQLLSKVLFRLTKRYTVGVSEQELHDLLIQPLSVLLLLVTVYAAFSLLRYPLPPNSPADFEPWPKVALLKLFLLGFIATIVWVVLRLVDFALLVVSRRTELKARLALPGSTVSSCLSPKTCSRWWLSSLG